MGCRREEIGMVLVTEVAVGMECRSVKSGLLENMGRMGRVGRVGWIERA